RDQPMAQAPGEVVPDELRPVKSATLYSTPGMSSPHGVHQPYLPVNGKGGEDLCGPYEPVEGWPRVIEPGWRLGGVAGVYPESPDKVMIVTQFGMRPERKTDLVWGRNVFSMKDSPFAHYREEEARNEHR